MICWYGTTAYMTGSKLLRETQTFPSVKILKRKVMLIITFSHDVESVRKVADAFPDKLKYAFIKG